MGQYSVGAHTDGTYQPSWPAVRMSALSVEAAGADRLGIQSTTLPAPAITSSRNGSRKRSVLLSRDTGSAWWSSLVRPRPESRLLLEVARKALPDWIVIRPTPAGLAGYLHAEAIPEATHLECCDLTTSSPCASGPGWAKRGDTRRLS
jgi:hypothetical protein